MGSSASIATTSPSSSFIFPSRGSFTLRKNRGTDISLDSVEDFNQNPSTDFNALVNNKRNSFKIIKANPTDERKDQSSYKFAVRLKTRGVQQSFHLALSNKKNDRYIIKQHHLFGYDGNENKKLIFEEIFILNLLNQQPNNAIIQLHEVFMHEQESMYMIFNFFEPYRLIDFFDFKDCKRSFNIVEVRRIAKFILTAIAHCHNNGIILREVSPYNVLVKDLGIDTSGKSNNYKVKIVDFTFAILEDKSSGGSVRSIGSHPLYHHSYLPYLAPELIPPTPTAAEPNPSSQFYTNKVDMWSLGVLTYAMVCGHLPFPELGNDDASQEQLKKNIRQNSWSFFSKKSEESDEEEEEIDKANILEAKNSNSNLSQESMNIWDSVPTACKEFIESCLQRDPAKRISSQEALNLFWFVVG